MTDPIYLSFTSQICTNASGHCSQRDLCCSRGENDTIEQFTEKNVYDTYNNCSGKRSCLSVQAPWQLLFSIAQTSTYVEINYNCVAGKFSFDVCGCELERRSRNLDVLDYHWLKHSARVIRYSAYLGNIRLTWGDGSFHILRL